MARPRKYAEGTEWAMVGLPITIAAKFRAKYGVEVRDAIVACLKEATPEMDWPEEGAVPPDTADEDSGR